MDSQIVAIFCLCDDILKGLHHHEDKQCKMSDAEVMTTSITAAIFFSGNMETARTFVTGRLVSQRWSASCAGGER
jgi:hypothetical protein